MRIDAHQHFWKFDPIRDHWIDDTMRDIQQDFLPHHLAPILRQHHFDGCIAVQADQSEEENRFLLKLAAENNFIKAIVGWVDLQAIQVEERLAYYAEHPVIKGFRHVLQGEPERDLMLSPAFKNGIRQLAHYHFTYDILIFPDQIGYAETLVKAFPNQKFIIDHLAKPSIKSQDILAWKRDIASIAKCENLSCKVSGLVTEAHWKNWKQQDFTACLNVVFEAFGSKRLLYGSDWPVCNLAGGYGKAMSILENYTDKLTVTERQDLFGGNALRFYNL